MYLSTEIKVNILKYLDISQLKCLLTDKYLAPIAELTINMFKMGETENKNVRSLRITPRFQNFNKIGGYTNLKHLEIRFIIITPEKIASLSHLKNLESLNVNNPYHKTCENNDYIPYLKMIKKLKSLNISNNRVSNDDLLDISKISTLRYLDVSRNLITDHGIEHLKELPYLKILNLEFNWLSTQSLIHLKSLPELISLNISGIKFKEYSIDFKGLFPNLVELSINRVFDYSGHPFRTHSILIPDKLSYLNITGGVPILIDNLKTVSLRKLTVTNILYDYVLHQSNYQSVMVKNPTTVTKCHFPENLREINFTGIELHQYIGSKISELKNISKITIDTSILFPEFFKSWKFLKLRSLKILNVSISNHSLHDIFKIKTLTEISLRRIKIKHRQRISLTGLTEIPELRTLELESCYLNDDDLLILKNLKELRYLNISSNNVSLDGIGELSEIKFLVKLIMINCVYPRPLESPTKFHKSVEILY